MEYFINKNIYTYNSGTEHSQANRTILFNRHGHPAKYTTMDYNYYWAKDAENLGLKYDEVLNMYDYFQGVSEEKRHKYPVHDYFEQHFKNYQLVDHSPNYFTITQAGRVLARINVMPETVGLMGSVQYYDRFENIVRCDNYDYRGFLSSVDYFHPDGQLSVRKFLDLKGQVILTKIFMNKDGRLQPTMFKLLNYHGKNYQFEQEKDLFTFFLNEIANENDGIYSDYRDFDDILAKIKLVKQKWVVFHGSHQNQKKEFYLNYLPVLQGEVGKITGIIVATDEQKTYLNQQFSNLNVKVVSDIAIFNEQLEQKPVWLRDRNEKRIIFSGRLENDKRPDVTLQAFVGIHQRLSTATMEFHGYTNNQQLLDDMKKEVRMQNLDSQVIFGNYLKKDDMNDFYNRGQILLNTSISEAHGMQMIEAMSHGVPVVSFDTWYGIRNLIKNGENGFIVHNLAEMIEKCVEILSDNVKWSKMSKAAYQSAEQFSEDKVWQQYENEIFKN